MDRGARDRIVNGRVGKGISALLLLALLLVRCRLPLGRGVPPPCRLRHRRTRGRPRMPRAGRRTRRRAGVAPARRGGRWSGGGGRRLAGRQRGGRHDGGGHRGGRHRWPAARRRPSPPRARRRRRTSEPGASRRRATTGESADAPPSARKPKPAAAPHPVPAARRRTRAAPLLRSGRRGAEELVYRVDFIGITMGYARFRYDGKGLHRRKAGVPPERAGLDVRGPLVHLPDQRDDRLLSRRGDARPDPAGVHAARRGKGRRGPLQPGDREDHVPVPAVGEDPEAGRHGPFRLRPGERRLLFPVEGPGRREPSAEHVRGPEGLPDLLARPRDTSGSARSTGRWTRSRSFR